MYNKVEICGVNTAKLEVLTDEQKTELLKKARDGDKRARERLINGNLRLVLSVIQGFQNRGECPDDLFQVGCVGLIKAVDNFDMTLDVKFSTYAVPMIIGEIRRYMRDNNMLRVSRSVRDMAYKAMQARERLSNELMREQTISEIASALGESTKAVSAALDAIIAPISLYEPVYSDSGDTLYVMDQIKDNDCNDANWIDHIALGEVIDGLGVRERRILQLRFFAGKTQTEVSKEIGISQAQVSRLEKQALEKMKRELS